MTTMMDNNVDINELVKQRALVKFRDGDGWLRGNLMDVNEVMQEAIIFVKGLHNRVVVPMEDIEVENV